MSKNQTPPPSLSATLPPWALPDRSASTSAAPALEELELSFDDNRLVGRLFGQFDQNLALIEQRLGLQTNARGNHVTLRGSKSACLQAKAVLDHMYRHLRRGGDLSAGDIEGFIRATHQPELFPAPVPPPGATRQFAQISTRRKTLTARTERQDAYIRALEKNIMIFGTGPAGTGKTYLAVAYAAAALERGAVDRLILSRPAVEAGERLGFLPGDMREKVDPYLRPLYDALYDMMPADRVERGLQSGMIEIAPLAFMRGRTLQNAIIILDEAQNCSSMQMKMFLTRLGENSKMIITGDPSQVDLPSGQVSGLGEAVALLEGLDDIGHIAFQDVDVVRHELVGRIVRAYDHAGR